MTKMIETYLHQIQKFWQAGQATEHSYRPALQTFLETFRPGITATNEPKHIACGAPDFIVEDNKIPLGYIETKDIGEDLDKSEKSEQLTRYRHSLGNLILTNYVEFRWYVDGQPRLTVSLATLENKKIMLQPDGVEQLTHLLKAFFDLVTPTVTTPQDLAQRLAEKTRFVQYLIWADLQHNEDTNSPLYRQMETFRQILLPALDSAEFADLYAQTIAYGLFSARLLSPTAAHFSRQSAYTFLMANRFLRRLFIDVGEELEGTIITPLLDDIVNLLNHADLEAILTAFGKHTRQEDPIVHFYETFLTEYDPNLRQKRGVYYTPEPVVQFMVRSVHELLQIHFDKSWGLVDEEVQILDPAVGTGTFLYFVVQQIYETLLAKGQQGQWPHYVAQQLLPRLFGFELLMAPYVVAHLKLGLFLKELGFELNKNNRLRVYLTNSLDEAITRGQTLDSLGWYMAEEASEAASVKRDKPIMVVLGNPPYAGHSANQSRTKKGKLNFIGKLVDDYYVANGQRLSEKNPKWLQDDYVKFMRFAQWRIEQTGHGIVAFITNHSYLDNPTFRGMRYQLLQTFDEIYLLDCHGNSKKKERTPEGGKDENLFEIQQGVAIFIGIKKEKKKRGEKKPAVVYQADLWGGQKSKYAQLSQLTTSTMTWQTLQPAAPFYLFVPQDITFQAEYEQNWKITDIMPIHSVGIITARDELTISPTAQEMGERVKKFASLPEEELRRRYHLQPDTKDWSIKQAQQDIKKQKANKNYITPILYRPFDIRYTYYTGQSRGFICRPRAEVMQHTLHKENLVLLSCRQQAVKGFQHIFCTNLINEGCVVSLKTREITYAFPLYLYNISEDVKKTLFAQVKNGHTPNFSAEFIAQFSQKLNLKFISEGIGDLQTTFGPEAIFYYAYAVFHSPTYRGRYAEFLKTDFPRLPLTSNSQLFRNLVDLGHKLADLHLLRSAKLEQFETTFPIAGSNQVEKISYEPETATHGRVYINQTQYFGQLPLVSWEFMVGGYQVCLKWLKDRKEQILEWDEINQYQKVVTAVTQTYQLMQEIDEVIPHWPLE